MIMHTFLLCLFFVTCFCASQQSKRELLKKKLDSSLPILEFLAPNLPQTPETVVIEFESILLKTLKEVKWLIEFCKNNPDLAHSHVVKAYGKKSIFRFAQFYMALIFTQASLEILVNQPVYRGEKDRMAKIFGQMRFIQHALQMHLVHCSTLPHDFEPYSTSLVVLTRDKLVGENAKHFLNIETLMTEQSDNQARLFIQTNADNLIHRINRLNLLLNFYHSFIFEHQNTVVDLEAQMNFLFKNFRDLDIKEFLGRNFIQIKVDQQSHIAKMWLSFAVLRFITKERESDERFFSSHPAGVLNMVESLTQCAKEDFDGNFFDRFQNLDFLRSAIIPSMSDKLAAQAQARLAVLEEISLHDQRIVLLNNKDHHSHRRGKGKKGPQQSRKNIKTHNKNTKPQVTTKLSRGANKNAQPLTNNRKKGTDHIIDDDDEEEKVEEVAIKMDKINYSITLPIDIHFIRFGQYCFDNVLYAVLEGIPNNEHYTWTMVADYCTTREGQDLLYKLHLTLFDVNNCIQVIRDRAERAHPKDISVEQVLKDISALLAFHHNFNPLKNLFTYIYSISEWKKVLGNSSIPTINNEEAEIVGTPDALLLSAVRAGEFCRIHVFGPVAAFLGLDPKQSSMTDIIKMAERHPVIEIDDGNVVYPKLLRDCQAIYQLRNRYAHQPVNKKHAAASENVAYGGRYKQMSIFKDDFVCKITGGQFF